ncbi:hypothetical protein ACFRCQ_12255 [Cytobacillus firmus]|uniref:hypothetical protein n=1 Tax=Cytobacillus firmus TaxID=1399 RepID=UPI0036C37523
MDIQHAHEKCLIPKLFSLSLIYILSVIPISIICVNFLHKFYFHPQYFLAFSTYKQSYVIFSAGFFLLFAMAGLFLYSSEVESSRWLTLTAVFLFGLSLFIFYLSLDLYTYVDEKGIHINSAPNIRAVDSYPWEEVVSVTQLNKGGAPAQLEG